MQQETKAAGSKVAAGQFGVPHYARRLDGLLIAATAPSSDIARRICLVQAAYHRWHNPLVLRPSLLRQPRFRALLEMRLRGGRDPADATNLQCGLAMLVDFVLAENVADAPGA